MLVAAGERVPPYRPGDGRERTDLMQFYAAAVRRVRGSAAPGPFQLYCLVLLVSIAA